MADTTPSQDPLRLAEALERMRPEFCGNQATLLEAAALIREQHAAFAAPQPNAAPPAAQRDELLQASLDFISTLTGMTPPPIEVAPPEVFAPFYAFVDRVQAITAQPNAALADGWMDIATAPENELLLVGWVDPDDTLERHCFDMLEAGCWQAHEADREHFLMVAPPGSRGPKEGAPYTHWKRIGSLPAPPTLNASKGVERSAPRQIPDRAAPCRGCLSTDCNGECMENL